MTTEPMPAAFLGHGSPMNALERNRYTDAWRELGASVPRPRGILVISAHWYVNLSAVTAMALPKTIHDFYGFPDELFSVQYPAPGDVALAEEVAEIAKPTWVGLDHDSWGLDHGTWSVLVHAFPTPTSPWSNCRSTRRSHSSTTSNSALDSRRCARRGVLVIGSGNVVHNLHRVDWDQPDGWVRLGPPLRRRSAQSHDVLRPKTWSRCGATRISAPQFRHQTISYRSSTWRDSPVPPAPRRKCS